MYQPAIPHDDSEINLTPMLDVVFIMLIFFLVTATFLNEHGVPVDIPPALIDPIEVESISVLVQSDSSFVVNGRPTARASLVPYVRALYSQNPEAGYSVTMGAGSKVGDIVAAVDVGRSLGFDIVPLVQE